MPYRCALLLAIALQQGESAPTQEPAPPAVLYNGIQLPSPWPPRLKEFPTSVEKDPVTPPYLVSPPSVVPIDVGRQLFVDDFLVAETTLQRTYHLPKYHPSCPVLKPDTPWELEDKDHAAAMVFSDGVWHDPKDGVFKMWYLAGSGDATSYATSLDGIHWVKPSLDVKPGTNIVLRGGRDSNTVWLDLEERNPERRYKMFRVIGAGSECEVTGWNNWVLSLHFSADGIHWVDAGKSGRLIDRSTVFWNPFRKMWVFSIRHMYSWSRGSYGAERRRSYVESFDVLAGSQWKTEAPLPWIDADRLDPMRDDLKIKPQLYNLDCVAYESILLGLFTIWRGQPKDRHKPNNLVVGYSRDGWHWLRPDRRPFCDVSNKQGDWNANNVQSAGGCCLILGDQLYFYVSGRAGQPGNNKAGLCSTGLATLRRDGFASLDGGAEEGYVTTRPVRFQGSRLFVNVEASLGELRAEALDEAGAVVEPFSKALCKPLRLDSTIQQVTWEGAKDLSSLANRPIRFRFYARNAKLYSFWVSPDASGASHGYVAAGGPGYTGPTDTVGVAAVETRK
jgi:hypothetical protein